MNIEKLKERVLDISRRHNLSHISSCISVLPILIDIYGNKHTNDLVLLDNGHASLAHYVVLEEVCCINFDGNLYHPDAEELLKRHGIHANRDPQNGLDSTNGSLGHNIGIGIGMALADKTRKVHIVVSDGSLQEGSNWEALRIIKGMGIKNIQIYANFNGYTAVAEINRIELGGRLLKFCPTVKIYHTKNGEGFDGVDGHYLKV